MASNVRVCSQKIVALEVRNSCIGYAVFDGPNQLLDYGTTSPAPLADATKRVRNKMRSILKLLAPAAIVVRRPHGRISQSAILRVIRHEAERHAIPVMMLGQEHIREAFRMSHAGNKEFNSSRG